MVDIHKPELIPSGGKRQTSVLDGRGEGKVWNMGEQHTTPDPYHGRKGALAGKRQNDLALGKRKRMRPATNRSVVRLTVDRQLKSFCPEWRTPGW